MPCATSAEATATAKSVRVPPRARADSTQYVPSGSCPGLRRRKGLLSRIAVDTQPTGGCPQCATLQTAGRCGPTLDRWSRVRHTTRHVRRERSTAPGRAAGSRVATGQSRSGHAYADGVMDAAFCSGKPTAAPLWAAGRAKRAPTAPRLACSPGRQRSSLLQFEDPPRRTDAPSSDGRLALGSCQLFAPIEI